MKINNEITPKFKIGDLVWVVVNNSSDNLNRTWTAQKMITEIKCVNPSLYKGEIDFDDVVYGVVSWISNALNCDVEYYSASSVYATLEDMFSDFKEHKQENSFIFDPR